MSRRTSFSIDKKLHFILFRNLNNELISKNTQIESLRSELEEAKAANDVSQSKSSNLCYSQ